jgi:phage gpG-like protein
MGVILKGKERTEAQLRRASQFLRRRDALDIAGEMVLSEAHKAFQVSRDPATNLPWASLMPSTIAARRGGGAGARPLLDRGTLRASLQRGGSRSIWRYQGSESLRVGTGHKTAQWHQFGTGTFGPKKKHYLIEPKKARMLAWVGANGAMVFADFVWHPGMPARPFLGVSQRLAGEISKVMARALEREYDHG